ncbi:protein windpipe [Lutzomyia longipalpis]|uniref:protein windpipe n=1 Tax=Lutzomyia longipalpis TaxID=7200 RepID=UPI0024842892|nr:protein windpipe [Lutzomyia longipalpis]XP_055686379.1 protein windpipe [Lutzomyia longipalpis]
MLLPSAGLATFGFLLLSLATPSVTANPTCPAGCTCILSPNSATTFSHVRCQNADHIAEVGPISVETLDLSNAGIVRLTNHLENLQNLTHLDLSNNRLSEANRLNKKIRELNLSYNRITSGKLGKLPLRVQVLNLTHNEITYLPMTLMKLRDLKQIELAGNRINCTCETLQVRNWLQQRHVWSDRPVKCHSPIRFKGMPWLQVKQADVCDDDRERNIWGDANDDNELMMGDAPASSGDSEYDDNEDNIEDDFIPFKEAAVDDDADDGSGDADAVKADRTLKLSSATDGAIVEGSGFGGRAVNVEEASESPEDDDEEYDDDGSGSGAIPLPPLIPLEKAIDLDTNSFEPPTSDDDDNASPLPEPDEEVTRPPLPDLGIFGGHDVQKEDEVTPSAEIVPVVMAGVEGAPKESSADAAASKEESVIPSKSESGTPSQEIRIAEQTPEQAEENRATVILLVVVGVALVGLVAFIIVKKKKKRGRRNRADAENPRGEEMLDMDKKLLGKPIQKNGNPESAPLMPNRDKSDYAKPVNGDKVDVVNPIDSYQKPPPPKKVEEPVQKQENVPMNQEPTAPPAEDEKNPRRSLYDNDGAVPGLNNNDTGARDHNEAPAGEPLTNGLDHAPPHLHNGQPADVHNGPSSVADGTEPDAANKYVPKSPALARYSPVYSPETGRVKIKLTETPKPKTPLLVTRSRSNAGDIITTPYTSPIRGQQQT